MEQLPENNTEQDNSSAAIPQASLGSMLREAREQFGLSVADVAAQTKFAPRQIEALEADDFENLPETAFLRGFVRSYAKILNVDAEILLAALPQAKAPTAELIPASVDVPFPVDYSAQKNLILLGAALLMAVIVVGFAVWHFMAPLKPAKSVKVEAPVSLPAEKQVIPAPPVEQEKKIEPAIHDEPKRQASVSVEKPSPRKKKAVTAEVATAEQSPRKEKAAPAEMITSAQSGVPARHKSTAIKTSAVSGTAATTPVRTEASGKATSLHLVFDEESWTEISDAEGNMLSSQINPPGSELNLKGHLPLSLVIGHAAATHLYQDGKPVDLAPYTNSSSEVARITLE
jgi:cytoskeleton protein RodZ